MTRRTPVISKCILFWASSFLTLAIAVDTDPGVDDITAILFALSSPELDILAYLVSFGMSNQYFVQLVAYNNLSYPVLYYSSNILKVYQAIQRQIEQNPADAARFVNFDSSRKPILSRGSDRPLKGELHSAKYFHGRDGLSDISERHPELNVKPSTGGEHQFLRLTDKPGVDVALDLLCSYPPRSITYITLGPLTNLAQLVQKAGNLFEEKIGRIICMGGALDVPGNTSPTAEFNFFADPFAVKELLFPSGSHSGLPLDRFLLLPLDITTSHTLPFGVYESKIDASSSFGLLAGPSRAEDKSPLTHFTSSFLERTRTIMRRFGTDQMELHDIVAIWCAIENPPGVAGLSKGWKGRKRVFDIERTGELTRGMLVVDRRNDTSAYSPGENRAKVQAELEKSGITHGAWESTAVPAQVEIEAEISALDVGPPAVYCITDTPGPDTLLRMLLERVWGYRDVIGQ